MIVWTEQLADILDDGPARRGWFMDLRREQDPFEIYLIEAREIEESIAA